MLGLKRGTPTAARTHGWRAVPWEYPTGIGGRPVRDYVEPLPDTWQPPGPHDLCCDPTDGCIWREAISGGSLPFSRHAPVEEV